MKPSFEYCSKMTQSSSCNTKDASCILKRQGWAKIPCKVLDELVDFLHGGLVVHQCGWG
jgi:hypothetical protein